MFYTLLYLQENEYKFHEGAQKRISLFPMIKPNVSPKTSPEKVEETEKRVRLPAIVREYISHWFQ